MASQLKSYQTQSIPLSSIPTSLPCNLIPEDSDHEAVALLAIEQLNKWDVQVFARDAQWRDIVALTGNIRSFHGFQKITKTWTELAAIHQPTNFRLFASSSSVVRYGPVGWVEARFGFDLPQRDQRRRRACSGILCIAPDIDNEWKICVLVTLLENIEGCGDVDTMTRLSLAESVSQRKKHGIHSGKDFFDCAIAGGGQAGLATAGRLKALGVSHVVLDQNPELGGNWLKRYKSFTLHTSKFHSEMPCGGVFSKEDPYFLSSGHLVAGYRKFVEWYGINVWLATTLTKATWDDKDQIWTLQLECHHYTANGNEQANGKPALRYIRVRHLVFAVGSGGQAPKIPPIANREAYKGEVLHSVNYSSPERWKGGRGIVVGCANSAHDVAGDMVKANLSSVTLLQRSPTMVLPLPTYKALFDPIYNEEIDLSLADKLSLSIPLNVRELWPMQLSAK